MKKAKKPEDLLHDDSTAFMYIFKVVGTDLSENRHVVLSRKDKEVFHGTYNECVDFFNNNKTLIYD